MKFLDYNLRLWLDEFAKFWETGGVDEQSEIYIWVPIPEARDGVVRQQVWSGTPEGRATLVRPEVCLTTLSGQLQSICQDRGNGITLLSFMVKLWKGI